MAWRPGAGTGRSVGSRPRVGSGRSSCRGTVPTVAATPCVCAGLLLCLRRCLVQRGRLPLCGSSHEAAGIMGHLCPVGPKEEGGQAVRREGESGAVWRWHALHALLHQGALAGYDDDGGGLVEHQLVPASVAGPNARVPHFDPVACQRHTHTHRAREGGCVRHRRHPLSPLGRQAHRGPGRSGALRPRARAPTPPQGAARPPAAAAPPPWVERPVGERDRR